MMGSSKNVSVIQSVFWCTVISIAALSCADDETTSSGNGADASSGAVDATPTDAAGSSDSGPRDDLGADAGDDLGAEDMGSNPSFEIVALAPSSPVPRGSFNFRADFSRPADTNTLSIVDVAQETVEGGGIVGSTTFPNFSNGNTVLRFNVQIDGAAEVVTVDLGDLRSVDGDPLTPNDFLPSDRVLRFVVQ
jgi:hypothetical protein